ncbi:MAG TPA: hypothetical protein P5172_09350 [Syntrophales bacterium]|nr:hypothetical protein [Syntrophales bacterium]HQI36482.1 hypothetical protein [Syntrophales bacterium]HRU89140.1 hypothetical protein [Syntrophales bacterium]
MKRKIALLFTMIFLIAAPVMAADSAAGWSAVIRATGQDLGGVSSYNVVFGVGDVEESLSAPPAPPEYSVKMELIGADGRRLAKQVQALGDNQYVWTVAVDPRGNIGNAASGTATLIWDLGNAVPGNCALKAGKTGSGGILVGDMKAVSSYQVTGSGGNQYYQLVCKP